MNTETLKNSFEYSDGSSDFPPAEPMTESPDATETHDSFAEGLFRPEVTRLDRTTSLYAFLDDQFERFAGRLGRVSSDEWRNRFAYMSAIPSTQYKERPVLERLPRGSFPARYLPFGFQATRRDRRTGNGSTWWIAEGPLYAFVAMRTGAALA